MNILFVTPSAVIPENGGIERITYSVSHALTELYAYRCFFLNLMEDYGETHIAQIVDENQIDVVIAQGADKRIANLLPTIRKVINEANHRVSLVFVYHVIPGVELIGMDSATLWNRLIHGTHLKANIGQLAVHLIQSVNKSILLKHLERKYRIPYDYADRIVLLSKHAIPAYQSFTGREIEKLSAIPNMLSFAPSECVPQQKKKIVLIVSRMDEREKRIKTALKIWRSIPNKGWMLKIVGVGEDWEYYKKLATRWKLQNISFEGLQKPLPYYQEASIFLMTSAAEGWGLTLTEAQQNGCVPIAFDSYSAVHDIIDSGRNGIIVPEGDIDEYVRRLQGLMNNPDELKRMSGNARKDCMRYSRENIAKQWKTLLETL